MAQWVLILTFMLLSQKPGEIRDISPSIIDGFTSKENCEAAAKVISTKLILLAGDARKERGIAANTPESGPSLYYECVQIQK